MQNKLVAAANPSSRTKALTLLSAAAIAAPALAQNPFMPPYQGAQPELVQGVQPEDLATEKPKIRHVYVAAPDVLALVMDAQAIPLLTRAYLAQAMAGVR